MTATFAVILFIFQQFKEMVLAEISGKSAKVLIDQCPFTSFGSCATPKNYSDIFRLHSEDFEF